MLLTSYDLLIFLQYLFLMIILVFLLFFASYSFVYNRNDFEKTSSYECGFNPFGDSRMRFEIRFFLVAILFIIFDLEIAIFFL